MNASPISTPLIAWMDISAAASRASSLRSHCTWLPRPGGTPYASTSTMPPRVSASFLAASTSATIRALASGSRQRNGSASIRSASSGRATRPGLTATEPSSTTCETISMPSAWRSSALATAPSATRAAVSRALARSRIGRASVWPYFCMPARSAWPGRGRVSGALRAWPASTSGSTGSAAITVCHLGHSVLPTRIATGLPSVQAVPQPADDLDLVLFERHPRAAAVAEPAAGQLPRDLVGGHLDTRRHALQDGDERGPCDSPAVSQRNTKASLSRRPQRLWGRAAYPALRNHRFTSDDAVAQVPRAAATTARAVITNTWHPTNDRRISSPCSVSR